MTDRERAEALVFGFLDVLDAVSARRVVADVETLIAEVRAQERELCAVLAADCAAGCVTALMAAGAREVAHAIRRRGGRGWRTADAIERGEHEDGTK